MSDWREHAACRGNTTRFFLEAFEPLALQTCDRCPVRTACQEAGYSEDWGVWGGLRAQDRRKIAGKTRRLCA